jgi:hypothetical protein
MERAGLMYHVCHSRYQEHAGINLKDEYPDSGACKEMMVKIDKLLKIEIIPATKLGSFILFWLL